MIKIRHFFRLLWQIYYPLIISFGFLAFLLGLRILITGTFFYSFLVWNLFLATLPYAITQVALFHDQAQTKKHIRVIVFVLWLALLPNAPYLITDIIHLHSPYSNWVWFDLFMVFTFACNGLLLYLLSLLDAVKLAGTSLPKKWQNAMVLSVCVLSGYGIYLGRFLRFNSWDILLKPKNLLLEILNSLSYPYVYLMSLAFGLFLWTSFLVFKWKKH